MPNMLTANGASSQGPDPFALAQCGTGQLGYICMKCSQGACSCTALIGLPRPTCNPL